MGLQVLRAALGGLPVDSFDSTPRPTAPGSRHAPWCHLRGLTSPGAEAWRLCAVWGLLCCRGKSPYIYLLCLVLQMLPDHPVRSRLDPSSLLECMPGWHSVHVEFTQIVRLHSALTSSSWCLGADSALVRHSGWQSRRRWPHCTRGPQEGL